jgi:hypothetical protein
MLSRHFTIIATSALMLFASTRAYDSRPSAQPTPPGLPDCRPDLKPRQAGSRYKIMWDAAERYSWTSGYGGNNIKWDPNYGNHHQFILHSGDNTANDNAYNIRFFNKSILKKPNGGSDHTYTALVHRGQKCVVTFDPQFWDWGSRVEMSVEARP